jgi:hypothetical protein
MEASLDKVNTAYLKSKPKTNRLETWLKWEKAYPKFNPQYPPPPRK